MPNDRKGLDYPFPEISIKQDYLQVVDRVLLAALGRTWECMRDLTSNNHQISQFRPSPLEELRTSPLGQNLLIIADRAGGGYVSTAKVERAIQRVYRMLFGDPLAERYTLPSQFHKTELGQLVNEAILRMHPPEDLMTPKQAHTFLGVSRQSLYDRANEGKIQKIYIRNKQLFLRSEIEAWKAQREQQRNRTKS